MSVKLFLEYSEFTLLSVAIINLLLMWRKGVLKRFAPLTAFLAVVAMAEIVTIPLLFFRRGLGIDIHTAWSLYVNSVLVFDGLQVALMIAIIYNVFHIAMRPLPGLQRLGKIVFGWVAGVSTLFALVIALGPHTAGKGVAVVVAMSAELSRIQEGLNVLILCLLLFVCFSTKALGLTYRSHIFGVSLGLGVVATVQLVQAGWLSTSQGQSVYSPMYLVSNIGTLVAFAVWGTYFAMPEPERKMILLPTTSPFFFWNRISEALGDNPGHVAISGIRPSPVEMKVMAEMGKKSRQREMQAMDDAARVEIEMKQTPAAS
jgi:hypothetical protein